MFYFSAGILKCAQWHWHTHEHLPNAQTDTHAHRRSHRCQQTHKHECTHAVLPREVVINETSFFVECHSGITFSILFVSLISKISESAADLCWQKALLYHHVIHWGSLTNEYTHLDCNQLQCAHKHPHVTAHISGIWIHAFHIRWCHILFQSSVFLCVPLNARRRVCVCACVFRLCQYLCR